MLHESNRQDRREGINHVTNTNERFVMSLRDGPVNGERQGTSRKYFLFNYAE